MNNRSTTVGKITRRTSPMNDWMRISEGYLVRCPRRYDWWRVVIERWGPKTRRGQPHRVRAEAMTNPSVCTSWVEAGSLVVARKNAVRLVITLGGHRRCDRWVLDVHRDGDVMTSFDNGQWVVEPVLIGPVLPGIDRYQIRPDR